METSKIISKEISFLALNLKMLRRINSISQDQLAKQMRISRSVIGAYEEDRAEPKLKTLIKLCDYFGVLIDDFLKTEITNVCPKKLKFN